MTQAVLAPQGADQPAGQMDAEQGQQRGQDASEGKSREWGMPHLQGSPQAIRPTTAPRWNAGAQPQSLPTPAPRALHTSLRSSAFQSWGHSQLPTGTGHQGGPSVRYRAGGSGKSSYLAVVLDLSLPSMDG